MRNSSEILSQGFMGNLTMLPQLQLLAGLSDTAAAQLCMVSPETYRRWRSDRQPNPTAVRLLSILAGHVPWRGWDGWEVHNGVLFPPGYSRNGLRPGDILAMPFTMQLVSEYRRQLFELQNRPSQHVQGVNIVYAK